MMGDIIYRLKVAVRILVFFLVLVVISILYDEEEEA